MICSSCGQPLAKGTDYCDHCGAQLQNHNDLSSEVNVSGEEDFWIENVATWRNFIGKNSDYYLQKWGFTNGVVTKETSWNWAAFFFGIFWLGYRKMYRYIIIFLASFLALDLLLLLLNVNVAFLCAMDQAIGIGISITLGLFGNYFYYLHGRRKIRELKTAKLTNKRDLARIGGTSGLGVLLVAGLFIGYVISYMFIHSTISSLHTETIQFGHVQVNNKLLELSDEFSPNDLIYYSFNLRDVTGPQFSVVIEKLEDGTSFVYDSWNEHVPPEQRVLIGSILAPGEEGQYIMKIVQDERVLARGSFFIKYSDR